MNTNPTAIGKALLTAIASTNPTKQTASNQQKKQKVSRRILPARVTENISVVCDATGIVSMMDIPLIPSHVLIWTSPLASLPNCRGLVQQGFSYLEKLDTQVLAGLLITIADSYSLLKYAPSDTGAQKNAILRTAGKLTLINCLLLIEEYINSHNRCFLPSLSLLFDTQIEQNGIECKLTEWMKLIAGVILRSSFPEGEAETEEGFYSEVPKKTITPDYIRTRRADKNRKEKEAKSVNWEQTNKKWAEQRIYKEDIKTAKNLVKTLIMTQTVSPKLASLLRSVFTEDSLLTMDSTMRALLSLKMSAFQCDAAQELITIIDKPYSILRSEFSSLSLDDDLEETEDTIIIPSVTQPSVASMEEVEQAVAPITNPVLIPVPAKKLSFTEILLAKKLAAAQNK